MRSLARTWRPDTQPSGDLVGEALEDFSLDDICAQAVRMCEPLERKPVAEALASLSARHAGSHARLHDIGIMKAMRNLFIGGRDALAFYRARCDGIFASRVDRDNARALLETAKIRSVMVRAELLTKEMVGLCRADERIGYHPEAERRQFTPETLERRLGRLAASRARLAEIEAELAAGRPWPKSPREAEGEAWAAKRDSTGVVVIEGSVPAAEGSVPAELGDVEVRVYDLCGTRTATVIAVKPDAEGRFRVELPREDDVRLRPAWIVVRYGRDFNNGGTRWIWPKRPEFPEPRLIQSRLTGDNFARVLFAF